MEEKDILVRLSFCSLFGAWTIAGMLCVRVKINERSFEPFCVWILDFVPQNKCNIKMALIAALLNAGVFSGGDSVATGV